MTKRFRADSNISNGMYYIWDGAINHTNARLYAMAPQKEEAKRIADALNDNEQLSARVAELEEAVNSVIQEFERLKRASIEKGNVRDSVYLDGVLAVLYSRLDKALAGAK